MSKSTVYGGQPEIQAFVQFYKVKVKVYSHEFNNNNIYEVDNQIRKLEILVFRKLEIFFLFIRIKRLWSL